MIADMEHTFFHAHPVKIDNSAAVQSREQEIKFLLPPHRVPAVIHWLRQTCQADAVFPANRVFTIYYDSPDRQFLQEKVNSDYLKTKVRIRWYTALDTSDNSASSWLEVKQKTGAVRQKHRICLPYSGQWFREIPLHDVALRTLPEHFLLPQGIACQAMLPVYALRYDRYRFYDRITRARMCVDSQLAVFKINRQLFQAVPPLSIQDAVLELKGSGNVIPPSLRHLISMGWCMKTSYSKYLAAYHHIAEVAEN